MNDVRILPVTAADRTIHPEMTDDEFAEMLAASRQQRYQGRFYEALVIWCGQEAVGHLSLLGGEDGQASEGIEVFPVFRRQGIAFRALTQLINRAASLGFRTLSAQIRTDNAASLALHRKIGFAITRTYTNRRGREVHDLSVTLKGVPMQHEMSLRPDPFGAIAAGHKRYELRLNDEKRQAIRIGDTITFTNTEDGRSVLTRVTSLHPFANFATLYASLPLLECGYTAKDVAAAGPQDMDAYYSPEKQAKYGVLGIGIEHIRYPLDTLPGPFCVRELTTDDIPELLRVAQSNPLYYQYMHTAPTPENLAADLQALPPRRTLADKQFFGWFDGDTLVAAMDLIARHPQPDIAFIGWFIVDAARQGKGLGRRLVGEVLAMLTASGVAEVRLGRVVGNPQSERFWHTCGFLEGGLQYETDGYTVAIMMKSLE